jgi:hypothetical protein
MARVGLGPGQMSRQNSHRRRIRASHAFARRVIALSGSWVRLDHRPSFIAGSPALSAYCSVSHPCSALGPRATLAGSVVCRFRIPETGIVKVGFRHIASELSHQIDNSHAERIRNDFQCLNRNVAFPALNFSHMCAVQPRFLGEDVLGQLPLYPQLSDGRSDLLLNILHAKQFRIRLAKTILVIPRGCARGVLQGFRASPVCRLGEFSRFRISEILGSLGDDRPDSDRQRRAA